MSAALGVKLFGALQCMRVDLMFVLFAQQMVSHRQLCGFVRTTPPPYTQYSIYERVAETIISRAQTHRESPAEHKSNRAMIIIFYVYAIVDNKDNYESYQSTG